MNFLESALSYAAEGIAVFPCRDPASDADLAPSKRGKRPAVIKGLFEQGHKDATTNPEKIKAAWAINPFFNIGADPASVGCFVVDTDPPLGDAELSDLELTEGLLPATRTFRSPRGGHHYWFKGSCPCSASKIGPGIDTRGNGEGYVLLPPSTTGDGSYAIENDIGPVEAPSWIGTRVGTARAGRLEAVSWIELDSDRNVESVRSLLRSLVERNDVAIAGCGGNRRAYEVSALSLERGLSAAKTHELMWEEWNPHCIPPWSPAEEDEFATIIAHAAEYMQNDHGARALEPAADIFAAFLSANPDIGKKSVNDDKPKFWAYDEDEQDEIPEPTWLLNNLLPAQGTVVLYGPPKHYKTFLAMDLALVLATGIEGWGFPAREPVPVVYIVGEAAHNVMKLHRPAWKRHHGLQDAKIAFRTIRTMPLVSTAGAFPELIETMRGQGLRPGLIVVDTIARAMRGLDENNAKDAGLFIEAMDALQREFGCCVLALHHTGKDATRGSRGSSVMVADPDTSIAIEADRTLKIASVYVREQRAAEIPDKPWTFQGIVDGRSLVFDPIEPQRYRELMTDKHAFSPKHVGEALAAMGARGARRAVTTQALATHLCPMIQEESEEARNRSITGFARKLRKEAKERLCAYAEGDGASLRWLIPSGEATEHQGPSY